MTNQKAIMAVLAHPDDETFGMGGTLALYARHGVKVHLVCATRGEAGEVDERYLRGFNSIGERRVVELRCAAEKLGLTGVHFFNYRDSGMPGSLDNQHPQALINASRDEVIGQIVGLIREYKPQVVLTFDPIGGYRHPDHIFIYQVTDRAFYAAGDEAAYPEAGLAYKPQKLYYHIIPRTALRWLVRIMPLFGKDPRKFGNNGDIDLKSIADVSYPTHARIDFTTVAAARQEASNCHASQGGEKMNKGVAGLLRGWALSKETFMMAYPEPQKGHIEKDLFEGVKPD